MHDPQLPPLPLVASSTALGFALGERAEAALVALALAVVSHFVLPVLRALVLRALAPSADLIAAWVLRTLRAQLPPATAPQSAAERPTAPPSAPPAT